MLDAFSQAVGMGLRAESIVPWRRSYFVDRRQFQQRQSSSRLSLLLVSKCCSRSKAKSENAFAALASRTEASPYRITWSASFLVTADVVSSGHQVVHRAFRTSGREEEDDGMKGRA